MESIPNAQLILKEWEIEPDKLSLPCAAGPAHEDLCPRCFNEVLPNIQGHCPICDYCIYCEI